MSKPSSHIQPGRRILVTGGAGFIGSHLCERLVNEGHDVICADNFYTGSKANIAHLLGHPNFELLRHDITLPLFVEVDLIFNMACPASPVHYQRDPVQTVKTCVVGTINMLGLAKRRQAVMVQASTSEVYGDPEIHPQRENYVGHVDPLGPRACYDEGKRCAETLCFDYRQQNGVDTRIARIFNTYGPRMQFNDGRVVSNFVVQALRGENITIYGEGKQTRSFCFVDDLVDGLLRLGGRGGFSGPVNLGNPHEITVGELAERVVKEVASGSGVTYHPLPQNDPKRRCPDIGLAKEKLGWQPTVSLEDGLRRTIANFRERLADPVLGAQAEAGARPR